MIGGGRRGRSGDVDGDGWCGGSRGHGKVLVHLAVRRRDRNRPKIRADRLKTSTVPSRIADEPSASFAANGLSPSALFRHTNTARVVAGRNGLHGELGSDRSKLVMS